MDELTKHKQSWRQGFLAGVYFACEHLGHDKPMYDMLINIWKTELRKPLTVEGTHEKAKKQSSRYF